MSKRYPSDWEELRELVLELNDHRCSNCHKTSTPLEVDHNVPVGQGGSHQISNLNPLCPKCHSAKHGDTMAPVVRWFTNGELSNDEFSEHKRFWKQLREKHGVPRYDPDRECVYIPIADTDRILK